MGREQNSFGNTHVLYECIASLAKFQNTSYQRLNWHGHQNPNLKFCDPWAMPIGHVNPLNKEFPSFIGLQIDNEYPPR